MIILYLYYKIIMNEMCNFHFTEPKSVASVWIGFSFSFLCGHLIRLIHHIAIDYQLPRLYKCISVHDYDIHNTYVIYMAYAMQLRSTLAYRYAYIWDERRFFFFLNTFSLINKKELQQSNNKLYKHIFYKDIQNVTKWNNKAFLFY